ncbi:hypothetical protein TNCV_3603311 [Trichonephila clavipes]|nr:hypothetical protein TNCV_3603311 [Trichonephila clavipes]
MVQDRPRNIKPFLFYLVWYRACYCKEEIFSMYVCSEVLFDQTSLSWRGCRSRVVKVSDHGRHVMRSSPAPLKTHRVGQRCMLNLLRVQTSFRWFAVVDRRGGASSGVILVT